jgi:hypothetical protein
MSHYTEHRKQHKHATQVRRNNRWRKKGQQEARRQQEERRMARRLAKSKQSTRPLEIFVGVLFFYAKSVGRHLGF